MPNGATLGPEGDGGSTGGGGGGSINTLTSSGGTLTVSAPTGPTTNVDVANQAGVTPGTYGSSTQVGVFVVDQQGVITSVSNVAINLPSNAQAGPLTGPVTTASTASGATTITPVITAGGPTGSATVVPVLTYNAAGQLTTVTTATIQIAESQVTGLTSDLALKAPLASPALTGTPTAPTATAGDNTTQIATDAFVTTAVNNAISGVNPAIAVSAATTAAGNTSAWTYNNGASGIGATFTGPVNTAITIDGITFNTITAQSLLVKNDTQSPSGAFNGIYVLTAVQTVGTGAIFTRRLDYDQPSDMNNTGAIPVVGGTANGSTSWVLTSNITTVGTSPLTYTQFTLSPTTIITTTTAAAGDVTGLFSALSLQDTVNVEAQTRLGALQAARRHGSSAFDNIPIGLQNTTTVAAASNGVNINTFTGSGTLTVLSTALFTSPSGPRYGPSPQILRIASASNAGATIGYVSYTGTTATTFTGCQVLNSGSGVLATGYQVYAAPIAVADVVVCADSILFGQGANLVGSGGPQPQTDWFTDILAKENRQAGFADPTRGWRQCYSAGVFPGAAWSNLAAGSEVTGMVGPSPISTGNSVMWNTGGNGNIIGDTFVFRRAVVHIKGVTNGATFQVSFNGGSSFTSSYASNVTGLVTVDSGDLGSCISRVIQVKQTSTGAGGVQVAGYLPYVNDGTSGIVGYNFAFSGTTTTMWQNYADWDTYWLPYIQPRRCYVALGVNDLNPSIGNLSLTQIQTNLTALVKRIQAAAPNCEVVLGAEWHVGNTVNSYSTGITNANWSTFVNTIAAVALATNCTFVDMFSWFGDAALWTVAAVTTTTATATATVASGGFPNVEVGMQVQGVGMPTAPALPVTVLSIAGNTINFTGNTAAIVGGTQQLTFTNDTLGISAQDGLHFGDSFQSTSGRDAQQAIADMFWNNLSYFRSNSPAFAPGAGWSADPNPWTYVSATQFTITSFSNLTSIYRKGANLTWTESGTVKYGVVVSSSFSGVTTTVNMIATTDYAMAATPDAKSTWYSYYFPAGFPSKFAFTPTATGFSSAPTLACQWSLSGGVLTVLLYCALNGTSNATTFTFTGMPVTSASVGASVGTATDNGAACLATAIIGNASTTVTLGKNDVGGAWTSSAAKGCELSISYPI